MITLVGILVGLLIYVLFAPRRVRRTFALACLRDGMNLHSLRMLRGHSTLAVLHRYLALAGEDLDRVH